MRWAGPSPWVPTEALALPGTTTSHASGINAKGEVVGTCTVNAVTTGFRSQPDGVAGFGVDLGPSSPEDINNLGEVTGSAPIGPGGATRAFLTLPQGTVTAADVLPDIPNGVSPTHGYDVNNYGMVAGRLSSASGYYFVNGIMMDVNLLIPSGTGAVLSRTRSVNDKGQVLSHGTLNGSPRAFLLDPTPQTRLGRMPCSEEFDGRRHVDGGHFLWRY